MLILIILATVIISLFIGSLLLYLCAKIFKVENLNYKKIFKIYFIGFLFSFLLSLMIEISFKNIELSFIGEAVLMVIVFYVLLKKYFPLNTKKIIGILLVWLLFSLMIDLAIVVPVKNYVVQPFYVNGTTMEPTLSDGDYLLIKVYDKDYQRGDIVVFRYPKKPSEFFIKRIVGLPNEQIKIKDSKIYINNQELNKDDLNKQGTFGDVDLKLGQDEFFVLGDNRSKSLDSRFFGPIKKDSIIGKYWLKDEFVSEIFENIN